MTAVYHSHVDVGAYLSELDLEYAEHALFPFPGADQIVIAVHERHVVGAGAVPARGRRRSRSRDAASCWRRRDARRPAALCAWPRSARWPAARRASRAPSFRRRRSRSSTARPRIRGAAPRLLRRAGAARPPQPRAPAAARSVGGGRSRGSRTSPSYLKSVMTAEAAEAVAGRFPGGSRCCDPRTAEDRGAGGRLGRGGAPRLVRRIASELLFSALVDEFAQLFELDVASGRGASDHARPRGAPGRLLRPGRQLRADDGRDRERRGRGPGSSCSSRAARVRVRSRPGRAITRRPARPTAASSST